MRYRKKTGKHTQLGLKFRTWGGARAGAGRKRSGVRRTPHRARPPLASRFPVHVTLKVDESLPDLRDDGIYLHVEDCLRRGRERDFGFRIVHYSILTHHLHLIVEAVDAKALTEGIRGLSVRIARRLNRVLGRRGRVFVDRYFARILKSPRQTRHCLAYVVNNIRRHAAQHGRKLLRNWIDDCSSGRWFDGWAELPRPPPDDEAAVVEPHTWLLAVGWKRYGKISINAVPGEAR